MPALLLLATAASCDSSERKSVAEVGAQDQDGAPTVDCNCGPGDVQHDGSIRVTLSYEGEVPLHDIAVHLLHGGDGCASFAPANPGNSQGLGGETVADATQAPAWEGRQPGSGYIVHGTARGPNNELAAWGCLDSIEVLGGDIGITEVTLELHSTVPPVSWACSGVAQTECEVSLECEPFLAWPKEMACVEGEPEEPPLFMGCGSSDRLCSASWTWAYPSDSPDEWHMFIDSCLPDGWQVLEDTSKVCVVSACEGLAMPDCEGTPTCLAEWGQPLQDGCTWGEVEYAGCRTGGEIDEHGALMSFPCALEPVWAHPAGAADQWYKFALSCVPDGWVSAEEPPCQ